MTADLNYNITGYPPSLQSNDVENKIDAKYFLPIATFAWPRRKGARRTVHDTFYRTRLIGFVFVAIFFNSATL